jgi:hypothetical protein
MEAEVGVRQLHLRNTKDGQQHRSQERAMELTLAQSLLKETALLMPWFRTFGSQS